MAMNSSGPISLGGSTAGQSINLENGNSATAQVSLNDTAVRNLAGVASGAITMPTNFYGKSNRVSISYTFSSNTADASLNLSSISGYSSGKSDITVTINSGIYLYATSTGSYGLNISGGTTGDTLTIVNNGFVMGMGGGGGHTLGPAQSGGPAVNLNFGMSSCTINNTNASAYIGGGGGGGGYGGSAAAAAGGGGAGGGQGGGNSGYTQGGTGGGIGSSGGDGTNSSGIGTGGGGGRIFPGTGGAGGSGYNSIVGGYGGGAGGGGAQGGSFKCGCAGVGGAGGSANNTGGYGSGAPYAGIGGGGGGWGASGGSGGGYGTYAAGSGGKAVNLNGKSVTWTSGNTTRVYGSVS